MCGCGRVRWVTETLLSTLHIIIRINLAYLTPAHNFTQSLFYILFSLMFIYFWERERESTRGRGAEREGDTESEAGSRLWAVSREHGGGLELTSGGIMTWAKVGRLTNWATQAPQKTPISKSSMPRARQMILQNSFQATWCSICLDWALGSRPLVIKMCVCVCVCVCVCTHTRIYMIDCK